MVFLNTVAPNFLTTNNKRDQKTHKNSLIPFANIIFIHFYDHPDFEPENPQAKRTAQMNT